MEKARSYHSLPKGRGISTFSKVEDEERARGNSFGTKRTHMEIRSPRTENMKSPTSNEEANTDVSANGFVTARAKLVTVLILNTLTLPEIYLFYLYISLLWRLSYLQSACNKRHQPKESQVPTETSSLQVGHTHSVCLD